MIKLNAVGDIFLGDYTISVGFGIRSSIQKYGYEHHFKYVQKHLVGADIVFGNLETIISDIGKDEDDIKSITCRGEKTFVNVLKNAGFNSLNIANNHILQHGLDAFQETMDVLEQNNIEIIGLKSDHPYTCKPVIKDFGAGYTIGILGYSFVNENFHKGSLTYASGGREYVINDIRNLKKQTDYVVVSCHWGIEYINAPSPNIRRLAREMVDSGASLIIGHHPHVVQGIEKYKNSVIFYSMGNFLFDFLWDRKTRESMIAEVYLQDSKVEYTLIPVTIHNNLQVHPMKKNDLRIFNKYMDGITSQIEIEKDIKTFESEEHQFEYYIKANRLLVFNQMKKLFYVLENVYRLDKRFIIYFMKKIIEVIIRRKKLI